MRRLPFPVILLVLFSACKKELPVTSSGSYGENIQRTLKRVLPPADEAALDYGRAARTPADADGRTWLRLPFRGKRFSEGFVLLQATDRGEVLRGRIIHLQRNQGVPYQYNGAITIRALHGTLITHSLIAGGFIRAFHERPTAQQTASLMPPEYKELSEVVVVASYSPEGDISYSEWASLEELSELDTDGSGYYYSLDGPGGGGSSDDGGNNGESGSSEGLLVDSEIMSDSPILIDYEMDVYKEGMDLEKYLKCFDQIPDVGAVCSIEIFSDIPVDTDSYMLFDMTNQSPGHTYIQIKKSNASQSVIQNIGFYPKTDWKSILTNAPIEGKFVDNGGHEFNASLKMNVSPENFKSIITEIRYLARFIKYDIDEYNCTDFALDVFNKVRTNKLEIPMYNIPGGITAGGTRTPQGLYNKLKQMKSSDNLEAGSITIGNLKNWVAFSTGGCN